MDAQLFAVVVFNLCLLGSVLADLFFIHRKTGILSGAIITGIISSILSYLDAPKFPWNLDTALMGIMFFYVGYLIKEKRFLFDVKCYIAFISVIIGVFCIINNPIDYVDFDGNIYGNIFLMVFGAILTIFSVSYSCYKYFKRNENSKFGKMLAYYGRHTLFIMGFDYFVGTICFRIASIVGQEKNWIIIFFFKLIWLTLEIEIWTVLVKRIRNDGAKKYLSF